MGGTGNTGQAPEGQKGVETTLAAGGDPTLPQWGAGAAAPGQVAAQQGLPALTEAPPSLRPYEEAVGSTGAGAGPSTGLLAPAGAGNAGGNTIAGPMGFNSDPYPTRAAPVDTFAAPTPTPAPVAETPKEFAAPTSFRPIYEATSEVNDELSRKYAGNGPRGWDKDPVMALEWLQAVADHGGDWRDHASPYYNIAAPAGMGKVYWPGDPARPK
jgi:hypothetical protein